MFGSLGMPELLIILVIVVLIFGANRLPQLAATIPHGGEVTGNPHDGAWLLVRVVEDPNEPSRVGQEDMVFFTDVEAVV